MPGSTLQCPPGILFPLKKVKLHFPSKKLPKYLHSQKSRRIFAPQLSDKPVQLLKLVR